MHINARQRLQLRLANALFVLLFLGVIGLIQWLGRDYGVRIDLTGTGRHSLSDASIAALDRLSGHVEIVAYASRRGQARAAIQQAVDRYRRHKSDLVLRFVDPDAAPDEVRALGAREAELILHRADASERVAPRARPGQRGFAIDEETLTNALVRLGSRDERWIVFLSGHGERSADESGHFDLSLWAEQLRRRGFKMHTLTLAQHAQIPANTSVLVIAGPRTRLRAGELKLIQSYVDDGGNLLWLADPGPLQGLQRLAESLGVEFLRGVVVNPANQRVLAAGEADLIAVSRYGNHPVVRDFDRQTLFARAGALAVEAPPGWEADTLLETDPSVWLETGPVNDASRFDAGHDTRGPLTLGVALTRARETKEQRIAILADGDFLSNSFVGDGANLDFGLSLANWLSHNDVYVSIPVRSARDQTFEMSPLGATVLLLSYFLVPLAAGVVGLMIWWRRRRR